MNSLPLPWPRTETESEAAEHVCEDVPSEGGILSKIIGLSRARAWEIVGGLSRPSKMPCYSWGIPAQSCITGSKLAAIEGSVCKKCYALKGFFRYPKVRHAYQRRLDRYNDSQWVRAMIKLVYWQSFETGAPYFRWFDSGDLQSVGMLRSICAVVAGTPEIRHWLPTREYRIVEAYLEKETLPENLLVRVSGSLIDGQAPRLLGLPTSTVHTSAAKPESYVCPARKSEAANCEGCRACWDSDTESVSYPLH